MDEDTGTAMVVVTRVRAVVTQTVVLTDIMVVVKGTGTN